jgi:hypothetical protein
VLAGFDELDVEAAPTAHRTRSTSRTSRER